MSESHFLTRGSIIRDTIIRRIAHSLLHVGDDHRDPPPIKAYASDFAYSYNLDAVRVDRNSRHVDFS